MPALSDARMATLQVNGNASPGHGQPPYGQSIYHMQSHDAGPGPSRQPAPVTAIVAVASAKLQHQQQAISSNGVTTNTSSPMPTTAASLMREGPRDFTVIRDVGDGSFGTVCLADWKSPLPSGTMLSPMQHPTTRPEYIGKRLVAIKKMKKPFPNWDECLKLKELNSLLAIPHHPNIIPLYDAFLMPGTKELHFVFECMEGNLYQLTKSRKGRPLAGGLVASIFQQIVRGLHHIHQHGYFHRDMKPENLLITTTGLADYPSSDPLALPGSPPEKDVLVIVKLADFGLARETLSKPPYTEYVSTRWYRAPEVLLRSRDYSNPVDIWALGTILAELVNLKPLFPGQSEVDQVLQICEVLGDPTRDYGLDDRRRRRGGGSWQRGIKMARNVGFEFPMTQPITFSTLFGPRVPPSLVDCIQDTLRYDPAVRLTTEDLINHYYYTTVAPKLQPPQARAVVAATTPEQQAALARQMPRSAMQSLASVSTSLASVEASNVRRAIPPSHSTVPQADKVPFGVGQPAVATGTVVAHQRPSPQRVASDDDVAMDETPRKDANFLAPGLQDVAMASPMHRGPSEARISVSPIADPQAHLLRTSDSAMVTVDTAHESNASSKEKRKGGKGWGLHMPSAFASNKQSQGLPSSNSHSSSLHASASNASITPAQQIVAEHQTQVQQPIMSPADAKKAKKEAEKAAREAEKAKRAAQEKAARERARAVMQKRNQIMASSNTRDQVEWLNLAENDMSKAVQAQSIPSQQSHLTGQGSAISLVHARSVAQAPQNISPASIHRMQQYPVVHHQGNLPQEMLSEKAWGKQPRSTHTSNSEQSSLNGRLANPAMINAVLPGGAGARGVVRVRDSTGDVLTEERARRQSMQSFQTRDSDPGPLRGPISGYPQFVPRPETTSSMNSAPSVIDAASSARGRYGADRSSIESRSVASSLDNQLILNMENMTAAESHANRNVHESSSPAPANNSRPSYSRQSHGSRTGSAHRAGSASPLHHTPAPRFHPYSSGVIGNASLSNPNVALSSNNGGHPSLPSLASIAHNGGPDAMENLQSDLPLNMMGPRPRSTNRRMSHGNRGISRGSAASRDGPTSSLRHVHAGNTTVLPPFSELLAAESMHDKASQQAPQSRQ